MRKFGNTTDRDVIVIMSHEEYHAISLLAIAIEGQPLERIHAIREWSGEVDMVTTFGAIKEFAVNQDLIRETIERLKDIKDSWVSVDKLDESISMTDVLILSREAITTAICDPDGLDGGKGEHVLDIINTLLPERKPDDKGS